jgi:hypothetical protein
MELAAKKSFVPPPIALAVAQQDKRTAKSVSRSGTREPWDRLRETCLIGKGDAFGCLPVTNGTRLVYLCFRSVRRPVHHSEGSRCALWIHNTLLCVRWHVDIETSRADGMTRLSGRKAKTQASHSTVVRQCAYTPLTHHAPHAWQKRAAPSNRKYEDLLRQG